MKGDCILGGSNLWLGGTSIETKCAECGKKFLRSSEHAYKREKSYYCSYSCLRKQGKTENRNTQSRRSLNREAAQALVEKCLAKYRYYTDKAKSTPTKTAQHTTAVKCAREWRKKLEDAQDYRRKIEEKES